MMKKIPEYSCIDYYNFIEIQYTIFRLSRKVYLVNCLTDNVNLQLDRKRLTDTREKLEKLKVDGDIRRRQVNRNLKNYRGKSV